MADTAADLVLVTGASGFIASHVVKKLLEEGYQVRGTVRSLKNEVKVAPIRRLIDKPKYPLELVEADLLNDDCWSDAVKGCTYVIHVASPQPSSNPDDINELLEPSVNGTIRVLKSCVLSGTTVKRVVYMSCSFTTYTHQTPSGTRLSEKDWPDPNIQDPVPKSKTLAEKAAWNFVNERKKNNQPCFELAVINPGIVMGPLVHNSYCSAMEPIKKLLERKIPAVPSFYLTIADVRDVATAALRAMTIPEAADNRHIICSNPDCDSLKDIAKILDKEFRSQGYNVPTSGLPSLLIKTIALVDKTVAMAAPFLDKKYLFDTTRMQKVLKIEPIPFQKSVIDMAYSMIEKGHIQK